MADVFSKSERSKIMQRVKSSGNKSTEEKLIQYFDEKHITGWRRHYNVKGHPDFVFLDNADNENAAAKFNSYLSDEYLSIKQTLKQIKDDIENARKNNLLSLTFLEERLAAIRKLKKSYETIILHDYFKTRLSERIDEYIDSLLQTVNHYYNDFKNKRIFQGN